MPVEEVVSTDNLTKSKTPEFVRQEGGGSSDNGNTAPPDRLVFESASSDNRKESAGGRSRDLHVDTARLPGLEDLFPPRGRRTYFIVIQDRRVVELREAGEEMSPAFGRGLESPTVDRVELARTLGCHPDKVSRDRKRLEAEGLVGRRLNGSKVMWRRDDVIAYTERKGLTGKRGRGRPRKYP